MDNPLAEKQVEKDEDDLEQHEIDDFSFISSAVGNDKDRSSPHDASKVSSEVTITFSLLFRSLY